MAEQSIKPFKSAIKKIIKGKHVMELNPIISRYLLHYRAMPQSLNGKSPAKILFNRKLKMWLILLKQAMNKQDLNYEQQIAEFYGLKTMWKFYPKDLVWYQNCQLRNKWEKKTIVKQVGPVTYLIDSSQNILQKHIDQLHAVYMNIEWSRWWVFLWKQFCSGFK